MEDVSEISNVFAACSGSHVTNITSTNDWFITYLSAVCQTESGRGNWTRTSWNITALSISVVHVNLIFGYLDMSATNSVQ